ncbi:alpha-D-ribose 1-methylphosphonate 5-triphosphate diphosphatase [Paenibacillus oryzisoli]|uniref:Alpha-D-ribose 1-methylphosphonate 5-triphosphate diphosphatase n=1 Tax=Paenibacillus oryzisoli TaxID=1850517 RepID=A0A198ACA8_9BACL|nr:alpha-D-ribose 1-methylphosphonate 5-triphosphate diphosphatase [Paenibacillus oryzisoli]OAS18730.1 alpha-D-ribose 1-methylphosphonate 5-triphosphate diphosphatase [Paenibacillus oryzisoli]
MVEQGYGKWILNASIVFPDEVKRGNIYISEGKIQGIYGEEVSRELIDDKHEVIDATDMYVLPGLIDIHCDAIEKEVQPRPNTLYPMDLAIYELDKKLAGNGITTMYQSVSLGVGLSLRGDNLLVNLLENLINYRNQRSMIRHRVHLRYELIHLAGIELANELIQSGIVDYLSFMNHAPGQGQYKKPGSFEAYVMKNQGVDKDEVKKITENAIKTQESIDWDKVRALAHLALSQGISIASHDDDSIEKIDEALTYGVTVSEFPLNIETAEYAKRSNLLVCVGAPNVVRGVSHDNNLRASDAIKLGLVDIICSDYLPSSLLHAVFKLVNENTVSLPKAVNMASLNPAKAMGIDKELGSIECGKEADLLLVKIFDGYPFIIKTFVNGKCVYSADFFHFN